MRSVVVAILVPLVGSTAAPAADPGIDRFDLGQRLVALERAWDTHREPAARQRALPILKLVVPQLLAAKSVEAAATLDRSRFLLRRSGGPTPARRRARPLLMDPATRRRATPPAPVA